MPEKKTKKNGLILSCWIVAALVLLIVFLVKSNDIIKNLKETAFFDRVFGSTPEFVKQHEDKGNAEKETGRESAVTGTEPVTEKTQPPDAEQLSIEPSDASGTDSTAVAVEPQLPETVPVPQLQPQPVPDSRKAESGTTSQKPPEPKKADQRPVTKLHVWFVQIDADGVVSRKEAVRSMTKTDLPLTASIQALTEGPLPEEQKKGYMSLVPQGTKLIGASVKNGIATLSFNEAFEYNSYGVEGYLGQLMQIVYTATSFPTVTGVQFLIGGQKKEYLGSEGVWIGSPLDRSSFR